MENIFTKCKSCPAFYLLSDERKEKINIWDYKRSKYISRMKKVNLILLGESMPDKRYFYDINTEYGERGLRYTLKEEFGKTELSDGLFLESFVRKGIILFDCALCPLFYLKNDIEKRNAATYCFLNINMYKIAKYTNVPIATIFPNNRGWNKDSIPKEIINRVIEEFGFESQYGLEKLYAKII